MATNTKRPIESKRYTLRADQRTAIVNVLKGEISYVAAAEKLDVHPTQVPVMIASIVRRLSMAGVIDMKEAFKRY